MTGPASSSPANQEHAIVGLKHELKAVRGTVRELKDQNGRWRNVCATLRKLAGLDEGQFKNLLQSESLTE
jgi:hypothetical protein